MLLHSIFLMIFFDIATTQRITRSCTDNLQQALASLIRNDRVLVTIPPNERHTNNITFPEMVNIPCNQDDFYANLKFHNLFGKTRLQSTSLFIPHYQTPEDGCYRMTLSNRNLHFPNRLAQVPDVSNFRLGFLYEYAKDGQTKPIPRLNGRLTTNIKYPRDADTFLFMYYIITSFYERYEAITYQLYTQASTPELTSVTQPCYVLISDLPRIRSIQYTQNTSQLHDKDIAECNPQLWTFITKPAPQRFHIQFPSGKLTTFVPRITRNDRIYYQRVPTSIRQTSIYWFTLSIEVTQSLQTTKPAVRVINWGYSHLLEHKNFFVPPALKSRFTSIIYRPITKTNTYRAEYNHTFPMGVTLHPLQLQDRLPRYRTVCDDRQAQKFIQPYGKFEIKLLKIRPPANKNDYCQKLPDPTTPTTSYTQLESLVKNKTHSPLTFFSWSASLDDHQHQNLTMLLSKNTTSLLDLLQKYQRLTETTRNYTNKLNQAQINARFSEFHVHYFAQAIFHKNLSNLHTHSEEEQKQIAENNLFSHQQYIQIYAKILWRIHFIRQNILQQALTMWRIQKSLEYLKTSTTFDKNFIY